MKKKTTDKLIEMEPGLWLDTQRGEVVFDSKWLCDTFSKHCGREPTAAEIEKLLDGYKSTDRYKSTSGFACVRHSEAAR